MLPIFLDSNIILGYSIFFDDWYDECCKLFYGEFDRNTGRRVKEEVDDVNNRRMGGLYRDLTRHFVQGRRPDQFFPSRKVSEHDLRHLRDWLKTLIPRDPRQILAQLRHLISDIRKRIDEAFNRISKPLVDYFEDVKLEEVLEVCMGNSNDAKLLTDALYWCEGEFDAIFCSNDGEHFIMKRNEICEIICKHKSLRKDQLPLKICHIKEIIS